jgi:cell division protein FtsL
MVLDQDTTKRLIMAKRYCVACLIPGVIIFLVLCAVEIICMGFVIRHEYVDNKNTTNKGFKGSSEWIALVIFSSITGAFYLIYMALIGIGIAITPPGLENFKPNATPVAGSESVTTPTAAFMETSDSDIYVVKKYKQFIPTRTKLFFYFLFILFLPLIIVAIVVITAVLILAASGGGGGGNCGNCGSCDCCNNTNRRPAQGAPAPAAVV